MNGNYKRVAIIIDSLGGGGAERVMINLAKGLKSAGHYPHIFCLESRKDHEVPDGIPVDILYQNRSLRNITRGRHLKSSAKRLEIMIKSIEEKSASFNLFLSNLDPTNAVVAKCDLDNVYYILHNSMEQEIAREKRLGPIKWFKKLKAKKVMNGKHLIAVSQGVADEALGLGIIKPLTVTRIYNPSDFEYINAMSQKDNPEIPSGDFLIHVGRVVKQKRHDVLLSALSLVPDIKLVLLCKDVEKVRLLAKKYGVLDRVITPGFTNNPYNWISRAKLMLLSSDFEGLPTVLIESLICNTPVVSTDCKYGPSEILTGDLARFLSACGSSQELADNIRLALNNPPSVDMADILNEVTMGKAVEQYIALAN